jgi:REP element-mobilizing transposase RayT
VDRSENRSRAGPQRGPKPGLPLRGRNPPTNPARRVILASHLVIHGYGHWLSNDPRGSGSDSTRKDELKGLGDVHHGRKRLQPPRAELRAFYRKAEPLLDHPTIWFTDEMRAVISDAVARVAEERGYVIWAWSVCGNHAHGVVRSHRDRAEVIWEHLADASRDALRGAGPVPPDHPVWSHRPYKVFLYTVDDVKGRIGYVEDNPEKERLPRQHWAFVKQYPKRAK